MEAIPKNILTSNSICGWIGTFPQAHGSGVRICIVDCIQLSLYHVPVLQSRVIKDTGFTEELTYIEPAQVSSQD
jgi:hypothetical protein